MPFINIPFIKYCRAAAVVGLTAFSMAASSSAADKMIYGTDDRLDYYEMPERFRYAADATVLMTRKGMLKSLPDGNFRLVAANFGRAYNLCPEVKFRDQPVTAGCSGALVGEDLVITAGHCVQAADECSEAAFVFDYSVKAPPSGKMDLTVKPENVYHCSEIVRSAFTEVVETPEGHLKPVPPDFALIRLDRKVTGRTPLTVNRSGGLKKGAQIFVTGYPLNLPLKFSANAAVTRDIDDDSYFVTNLDAFQGNSGSPVLNAGTGLVEGILVRGEDPSFVATPAGCKVYNTLPDLGGTGLEVNKIGFLLDNIPQAPGQAAAEGAAQPALDPVGAILPLSPQDVNFDW